MTGSQATNSTIHYLPWLLQSADALFPTGAYAHSLGFEESVRLGLVRDEPTLLAFLRQQIIPLQTQLELPYLRFAFDADTLAGRCAIDHEIGAWKLAPETRHASTQLGIRRLKALRAIHDTPLLAEYDHAVQRGDARGHHLVICALQARVGEVPLPAALATYFYQSQAAICAAALKLIRIGQDGIQRVVRAACVEAPRVIEASLTVPHEAAGSFAPLLEIASLRHARAAERLFIS